MSAAKQNDEVSIASEARLCLAAARGDLNVASERLLKRVRTDARLRDALVAPLLAQACRDAINREIRTTRATAWSQDRDPVDMKRQHGRVIALAQGTLLMFPLPGGKLLQDATREEIAAAAQFYERQSADMAHKARWLQLVAQSVPNAKTAGKVLTDARLRELQDEARNA